MINHHERMSGPTGIEPMDIALTKMLFQSKHINIFLFLKKKKNNICCGYSLDLPHQGASNEYPQHIFSWRNKKNIYLLPTLVKIYG